MKAFPIYRFDAEIEAPITRELTFNDRMCYRAMPDRLGWYREHYGGEKMLRTPLLDGYQARSYMARWFAGHIEREPEIELAYWDLKYLRHDTWASGWFSHWRFDTGESDQEVLDSFEKYVSHCERINWRRQDPWYRKDGTVGGYHDPRQLMGAEDRYRWCGSTDGSESMLGVMCGRTDPPCRCDGCQSNSIVRICH